VVKKASFDSITPEHQVLIRDIFQRHFIKLKDIIRRENQDALNLMLNRAVQPPHSRSGADRRIQTHR